MKVKPPELKRHIADKLIEFSWNSWSQMGISGWVGRLESRAIDPEALLLLTLEVARKDPRLFDEVLDWMATNGHLLNGDRIRHLLARHPGNKEVAAAAVHWAALQNRRFNWKSGVAAYTQQIHVFDPAVAEFVANPDPTFASFGLIRPKVVRSNKSERPDFSLPINFAFKLRLLFGPGTRPEIIRVLLTCDESPLDAARISEEAAFSKRNVHEALLSMVGAEVVSTRWSGNERLFEAPREKWAGLLEAGPAAKGIPGWAPWIKSMRALTAVYVWIEERFDPSWSPYIASSEARSFIDGISRDLDFASVDVRDLNRRKGPDFWQSFEEVVLRLLKQIEDDG